MFILLPTCDSHASIATISLALLERYWPEHPPVRVLHGAVAPRVGEGVELHRSADAWLEMLVGFLRRRMEESFILLLDDYALCGPPRRECIELGAGVMRAEPSVGLFPLGWYPAARRIPRAGRPGVVHLEGAPVLLQAALWRRSAFLNLAAGMDPQASPWGFEAAATRLARRAGMEICSFDMPEPAYRGGHLVDGFDKADWALPYHNLMHNGKPELEHERFLQSHGLAFPSRGVGDTVAKIAQFAGVAQLARLASQATGQDCGCAARRQRLNERLPYRAHAGQSRS